MSLPSILGPLPESLRRGVYEAYPAQYGQFMVRVIALQEGTMSLEKADNDVFNILGYDQGPNYTLSRTTLTKSHRPDLYRMFVEWSTGEQGVVAKKKKKNNVPFSFGVIKIATAPPETPCLDPQSMPGPLSENLSPEVCQELVLHELAFHQQVLEQLADKVHRLNKYCGSKQARIDTKMPLKQVDNDVFTILGYDGGFHQKYGKCVVRDASCISHRPDLYQMFVEWSTSAPPLVGNKKHKGVPFSFGVIGLPAAPRETLRLDSLTSEVLVKDLIALDAVLSMSQTMQTALCTGVCVRGVPFSFGAMRDRWQKELLNRVSTVAAHK